MTSRLSKIATPLLVIGLFCAYLIAAVSPDATGRADDLTSNLTSTAMSVAVTDVSTSSDALPDLSLLEPLAPSTIVIENTDRITRISVPRLDLSETATVRMDRSSGSSLREAVSATEEPPQGKYKLVWCVVTAYCPCARCCGRNSPGVTSTGTSAWQRGIAADPRTIPYHTRVYVDGYGYAVVDDTGGAMRKAYRRGNMPQIDLRMKYHWLARQWGRKVMQIRVYEEAE